MASDDGRVVTVVATGVVSAMNGRLGVRRPRSLLRAVSSAAGSSVLRGPWFFEPVLGSRPRCWPLLQQIGLDLPL
jgi:hypothetical protein